jgi:hypothetical protein
MALMRGGADMTEAEKAGTGAKERSPIIRLILENPISAFNTAAIIFGGGMVYSSNESRMSAMGDRVTRLEIQIRDEAAAGNVKDDRTTQKIESITRDMSDIKATVRGIEASVQFLVRQATPRAGGPQ